MRNELPFLMVNQDVMRLGQRWCAARGSGKTVGISRTLVVPMAKAIAKGAKGGVVVIDPLGSLTNDILGALVALDPAEYSSVWDKVIYVPLGGHDDRVVPMPYLYTAGSETLEETANRVTGLWLRLDPALANAPLLGANKIKTVGRDVMMVMAGLGLQITEVEAFLAAIKHHGTKEETEETRYWVQQLLKAWEDHPFELERPMRFLLDVYPKLREEQQKMEVEAFVAKVSPYARNPTLAAQYGSASWGWDVSQLEEGQIHLIDASKLRDEEKLAATTWVLERYREHWRRQGPKRDPLTVLVLEEFAILVPKDNTLMEDDFDRLLQMGRNHAVSIVASHQSLDQLSLRTNGMLMQLGVQLFGSTQSYEQADTLARTFNEIDPYEIKETRVTQRTASVPGEHNWMQHRNRFWDETTNIYVTPQEQMAMFSAAKRHLPKWHFLAGVAEREGELPTHLRRITLKHLERGPWPQNDTVELAKSRLAARHGRTVQSVLDEIRRRRPDGPNDGVDVTEVGPKSPIAPRTGRKVPSLPPA